MTQDFDRPAAKPIVRRQRAGSDRPAESDERTPSLPARRPIHRRFSDIHHHGVRRRWCCSSGSTLVLSELSSASPRSRGRRPAPLSKRWPSSAPTASTRSSRTFATAWRFLAGSAVDPVGVKSTTTRSCTALMASMLRNNPQLFNLYVGYEDGSFLEMDVIDRAKSGFRSSLQVDEDAAYRAVVISANRQCGTPKPVTRVSVRRTSSRSRRHPGPTGYDPRQRPWYVDAFKDETDAPDWSVCLLCRPASPATRCEHDLRRAAVASWQATCCSTAWKQVCRPAAAWTIRAAVSFNDADRPIGHPEMDSLMDQTERPTQLFPTSA